MLIPKMIHQLPFAIGSVLFASAFFNGRVFIETAYPLTSKTRAE